MPINTKQIVAYVHIDAQIIQIDPSKIIFPNKEDYVFEETKTILKDGSILTTNCRPKQKDER